MGVTFFFILSGFLISYLLFNELHLKGKINILNFYARRILRIWPLYFTTVLIGFVIYPMVGSLAGHDIQENANPWMYVLFAANFDHIYGAFPVIGMLGVQWSVCVEEQFYLIWPILLVFVKTTLWFPIVTILLIIFSQWFYVSYMYGLNGGPYHLFCCFRFLGLGALMAWICFYKFSVIQKVLSKMNRLVLIGIYAIGFSLIIFQFQMEEFLDLYKKYDDVLPSLFFAFIILEQNYSEYSFLKFSKLKFMTYLGKISYGMYLLHMVAIYITIHLFPADPVWIPIQIVSALVLTIVLSIISYTYFESPFLKLKLKFS